LNESAVLEKARVPAWAWLVTALAVATLYALTLENGAVLARAASTLHELFHDARHFVGVPCH
jgi:hypothetical protein